VIVALNAAVSPAGVLGSPAAPPPPRSIPDRRARRRRPPAQTRPARRCLRSVTPILSASAYRPFHSA